jgi:hypothetical protein
VAAAAVASGGASPFVTWRLEGDRLEADADAPRGALRVGSLQKPFVAKAWALGHPGAEPPRVRCDASSGCWLRAGHGVSGLARATALSCNTYFHQLAAETPVSILAATLRQEGFGVAGPLAPDAAIGLESEETVVTVAPAALLEAYRRLTREPWGAGDAVRRELLAGLREAPLSGTARGLGRRGYWAKTGTVAAIDGQPLATSGLAVAVDDAGRAVLGLLTHGTGREAARALSSSLATRDAAQPDAARSALAIAGAPLGPGPPTVRVSLFGALAPSIVEARLLEGGPALTIRGYLGPGASVTLRPGDRLAEGLWEVALPERRIVRRVKGALECAAAPERALRVVATLDVREYVTGVLAAELPEGRGPLRETLAAAVLRFVSAGPRHAEADFCDTTHCAWFVGRGPRVSWRAPEQPILLRARAPTPGLSAGLDDAAWARAAAASRTAGPALWTGHCGGAPLSPHAIWGNDDRRVFVCPRHGPSSSRPWSRVWSDADVARAFGAPVQSLSVAWPDGVWTLEVVAGGARQALRYDDAHRALAEVIHWGALPSPATRVSRAGAGWRAEGTGLGHRVGLCLGDSWAGPTSVGSLDVP